MHTFHGTLCFPVFHPRPLHLPQKPLHLNPASVHVWETQAEGPSFTTRHSVARGWGPIFVALATLVAVSQTSHSPSALVPCLTPLHPRPRGVRGLKSSLCRVPLTRLSSPRGSSPSEEEPGGGPGFCRQPAQAGLHFAGALFGLGSYGGSRRGRVGGH